MKTLTELGVIGMAEREARRRNASLKAWQQVIDRTFRWVLFPLLKFGVVIVAGIFLLILLSR